VCTVHGRSAASFERGEYARTILGHASLPIAPAAMMCRVFVMAILPRVKRENTFAQGRSSASCQQIIGPNREMSDTFARSVMDRVGDRSDRAYAHDFTNTLRTKRIHSLVGLIDKRDI
jgi:hypothetical protein